MMTLATWGGWILALIAVWAFFRKETRILGVSLIGAFVCLIVSKALPAELGRAIEGNGVEIPVVWFYAPVQNWLAVIAATAAGLRLFSAYSSITPEERMRKVRQAGIWAVVLGVALTWAESTKSQFTIFSGAFFAKPSDLAMLAVAVLLVILLAQWTRRTAILRRIGTSVFAQILLILGSLIFSLPFAWMLVSSFKEDRDFAGGIKWVPQVTSKVPYFDPTQPVYSGKIDGTEVEIAPIKPLQGDRWQFDVIRPFAMRGRVVEANKGDLKLIPSMATVVTGSNEGLSYRGFVTKDFEDGSRRIQILSPQALKGKEILEPKGATVEERPPGLRWQNYPEAIDYLPPESLKGLVFVKNTLILVVLSVIGTLFSCSLVAYSFARLQFPGKNALFTVLLSTMMLPAAVTLMPQFLIFKELGWIDTLLPLWVPTFFASAFNVFMLRQFFGQVPMELEDAAKIDGCSYLKSFWSVMLPQIKPALVVVAIWTIMGTWNNFMGPLVYINSPENMPIAYALQLYKGERVGEPGLLMAFAVLTMLPILALFFAVQKYFIEGVSLSGLGGR